MFIEALSDTAHVFKAAEETFNDISFAIKPFVVGDLLFIRGPARNDWNCAVIKDCLPNGTAVIGFISANRERRRSVPQQIWQAGRVMRLSARKDEFQRSSPSIDHGMELRRATAA